MQTPSELHLPWGGWRAGQRLAIRTALGKRKRHIVIQAPTGSGKTAIAGALCQIDGRRTCILTATNGLTRQYEHTLPWLSIIRGAGNYRCHAASGELARYFRLLRDRGASVTCDDGPCRSGIGCSLKEQGCDYYDAYRNAKTQRTVLTNYAYFFAIHRFGQGLLPFDRVVLDEAHDVADQLMKASAVELARHHIRGRKLPRTVKAWQDLATLLLSELPVEGAERDDERMRIRKLRETLKQLTQMDDTWAWDQRPDVIEFQPTVPRLLLPSLMPNINNLTCVWLSATITPASLALLGIDPADIDFHVMPSRFPVSRRPIYVVKSVRVDSRMSDIERDYWIKTMDRIIATRRHLRGIIHTVSYARAEDIMRRSKYRDLMVTHAPGLHNLDRALRYFRSSNEPRIMVSPALTTGYDFKHDDARWQILAKLPFPDTRSAIMKARAAATLRYTDNLTMQTIVQTSGRINREDTDWGECVSPETRILTDDLRWIEAGQINEGTRLLAFDENGQHFGRSREKGVRAAFRRRKWRWSTVIKNRVSTMPRVRVMLNDKTLVCTPNHPWLILTKSNEQVWRRADMLSPGDRLIRLLHPWDTHQQFVRGWLSGFADGEGHLARGLGTRNRSVMRLFFSQNVNDVALRAVNYLGVLGFKTAQSYATETHRRSRHVHIKINGGICEQLRFLGQCRPVRLMRDFLNKEPAQDLRRVSISTVLGVEGMKRGPICSFQTSTKTYIAEGFGAHNTFIVDNHAEWFLPKNSDLAPGWFSDAVQFVRHVPDPLVVD